MSEPATGLHVAMIMDGNGRWATARALPRAAGHRAGAATVRRVVEAAPKLGVRTLTLFAFSHDNWKRPPREVATLMRLFRAHLASETPRLVENGVRLTVIGRRDRLSQALRAAIEDAERVTRDGTTLSLRVAIDYSARDEIVRAAERMRDEAVRRAWGAPPEKQNTIATDPDRHRPNASATDPSLAARERFAELLGAPGEPSPDVDLVIRTSGEQRLSDFLLWECAYAELYFTPRLWPEFSADDFARAIAEFHSRNRRFGALPEAAAG